MKICGIIITLSGRQRKTPPMRVWRNWQTRKIQVLMIARLWRFKSSNPHQNKEIGFIPIFLFLMLFLTQNLANAQHLLFCVCCIGDLVFFGRKTGFVSPLSCTKSKSKDLDFFFSTKESYDEERRKRSADKRDCR